MEHGGSAPAQNATRLMLSLQDGSQHCYEFQSAHDCAVFRCAMPCLELITPRQMCGAYRVVAWSNLVSHCLAAQYRSIGRFALGCRSVVSTKV